MVVQQDNTLTYRKQDLPNLPFFGAIAQPSLCRLSDTVAVVVGGVSQGSWLKSCFTYDVETHSITTLPEMNEARWSQGSCVHGDYLYTFGGHRHAACINSIEKLQVTGELGPASRAWQLIPASQVPNYTPRGWTLACPLNADEIVLIGGNNGVGPNDDKNDIQIYDVATDSCTSRIEAGADFTFFCESNGSI